MPVKRPKAQLRMGRARGKTVDMPTRDSVPGLAAALKAAREKAGLSQADAADRSGVHRVSINRFESDTKAPSVKTLYALARAYGVTVCDLLPPADDVLGPVVG